MHSISVLDKTSMFTVFSSRNGQQWTHQVKALEIIWKKLPQLYVTILPCLNFSAAHVGMYSSSKDTVHIDDLVISNLIGNPRL
jgi:hypothetical protein